MGSRNPVTRLGAALVALACASGSVLEAGEQGSPADARTADGGSSREAPHAASEVAAVRPDADAPLAGLSRRTPAEAPEEHGALPEGAASVCSVPAASIEAGPRAVLACAEAAPRAAPLDPDSLYRIALTRWRAGEKAFALRCFEEMEARAAAGAKLAPAALAVALRILGQNRLDAGRYPEAEDLFRRSLVQSGSGEGACAAAHGFVLSLRRQGRLDEAVAAMEAHLESHADPRCAERSLFMLGYLEGERGERERAEMRFRDCAARYPDGIHGLRARRRLEAGAGPARPEEAKGETGPPRAKAPGSAEGQ